MRTIGGDDERLRRGTGRRRFPTILGSSAVPLPRLEIASTLYPRFLLDDATSAALPPPRPHPPIVRTTTQSAGRRRTLEHERFALQAVLLSGLSLVHWLLVERQVAGTNRIVKRVKSDPSSGITTPRLCVNPTNQRRNR